MCGLIGYSGRLNYDPLKINFLMMANVIRGTNSTGIYFNKKILKDIESVQDFLSEAKNKIEPSNLFIGHTRKASVGAKIILNAHPFKIGSIVGAHNGTIDDYNDVLTESGATMFKYDTDSEALIHMIDYYQEDLSKILPNLTGAAALIWTNEENGNLNLYRNSTRPLYYYKTSSGIYVSSMKESFIPIGAKEESIHEAEEDTHYIIKNGEIMSKTVGIKIKTKVYTAHGYSAAITSTTPALLPNSYAVYNHVDKPGFVKDKYYFVQKLLLGVDYNSIEVIDDFGKIRKMHKVFFDRTLPIVDGSKCKIIIPSKKVNLKVDDSVAVVGVGWEGNRKVIYIERIPYDKKQYTIPPWMIRPMTNTEWVKHNEQLAKDYMEENTETKVEPIIADDKMISAKNIHAELLELHSLGTIGYNKTMLDSNIFTEELMKPLEDLLYEIKSILDNLEK